MRVIDAHQHVWDLDRAPYPWLGPHVGAINRTFAFEELRPHLARAGVQHTILVQSADNAQDTEVMLEVAAANREVAAVVVYVPLERPEEAEVRLAQLREDPHVVGVRSLVHDQADPDWILRADVDEGLGVLERAGVTFDYVAVLPRHLEHVSTLSERHPELRLVIDHLGKPPVGDSEVEPWWSLIERAAANPLVHAKVSGLYPGTDPSAWTPDAVRPFVHRAVEVFSADRLMYGGDWPVSVLAGGYDAVWSGLSQVLGDLDDRQRAAVWAGTAERFYQIDKGLLAG